MRKFYPNWKESCNEKMLYVAFIVAALAGMTNASAQAGGAGVAVSALALPWWRLGVAVRTHRQGDDQADLRKGFRGTPSGSNA